MPWKNKEAQKAYAKAYYLKNKQRIWTPNRRRLACKKYRENNKEKLKKAAKEYYLDNKDTLLQKSKGWRIKNESLVKAKDHAKTESLSDAYMKKHLLKKGYTRKQIRQYPELLEIERVIIKIKRLCKTSQN